jgi:hypothetical protein
LTSGCASGFVLRATDKGARVAAAREVSNRRSTWNGMVRRATS